MSYNLRLNLQISLWREEHTYHHGLKNALCSTKLGTFRTLLPLKRIVATTGNPALTASRKVMTQRDNP